MLRQRLGPFVIAMLFLVQTLALALPAAAHTVVGDPNHSANDPDIRLVWVEPAGNDLARWFVSAGELVTINLTIQNYGAEPLQAGWILQVVDLDDTAAGETKWTSAVYCQPVSEIIESRVDAVTKHEEIVQVPIRVPGDLDPVTERRFEFFVNPGPVDGKNSDGDTDSNGDPIEDEVCSDTASHQHESTEGDDPTATGDNSLNTNYRDISLAIDMLPDLRLETGADHVHPDRPQARDPDGTGIIWCGWADAANDAADGPNPIETCSATPSGEDTAYTDDVAERTYFAVNVTNPAGTNVYMGGDDHLVRPGMADIADNYEAVDLEVRVEHLATGEEESFDRTGFTEWGTSEEGGFVHGCGAETGMCTPFSLFERAGRYRITVTLDPKQVIPDSDRSNNVLTREVLVNHVELTGSFDLTSLIETHGADANGIPELPASGNLDFEFTIENLGTVGTPGNVAWSLYLMDPKEDQMDRLIGSGFTDPDSPAAPIAAGDDTTVSVTYQYSDDPNHVTYIRGGLVQIKLFIDQDIDGGQNAYYEECEGAGPEDGYVDANCAGRYNVITTAVKIEDNQAPVLDRWGITWEDDAEVLQWNEGNDHSEHKGKPLNFTAIVIDNDLALTTEPGGVTLVLTDPDGNVEEHVFPISGVTIEPRSEEDGGDRFWFNLTFPEGIEPHGDWTYTLKVQDHSGNTPEDDIAVREFAIDQWPIQLIEEESPEAVCSSGTPCDGDGIWVRRPPRMDNTAETTPDDYGTFTWRVHVTEEQTGIEPPAVDELADNVRITIWTPDGEKYHDRAKMLRVGESPEPLYSLRQTGLTDLGTYSSLIEIEDYAGEIRELWWNFTARDALPTLEQFLSPLDSEGLVRTMNIGNEYDLSVKLADDSGYVAEAYANWTHEATGFSFNQSLIRSGENLDPEAEQPYSADFGYTFSTGWLEQLPYAGEWDLEIVFREVRQGETDEPGGAGLWQSRHETITFDDSGIPDIQSVVVSQTEEEAGNPITWLVAVEEESNFNATLTINKKGGSLVETLTAEPDVHGEMSFEYTFTDIDTYEWRIQVEDSAGNVAIQGCSGVLRDCEIRIVENAAPRFTVTKPSDSLFVPNLGSYFVPPKPEVQVLVFDNNGIFEDNITVHFGRAGTELVDVTGSVEITPNTNPPGFFINLTHTNVEADGTTLTLRIDAEDLSSPARNATGWFNFTVDATPPQSLSPAELDFQPRYRADPTLEWRVREDSVFKISALDSGGSGVDFIRYRIDSSGDIFTVPLTGFTLPTTKPGKHTIHYSAVDRVGNAEDWRGLTVWLDNQGPLFIKNVPTIDYEVSDKWTNFTVIDEAGVQRVSTFYRVNNQEYTELPLTYNATKDMWVGQFPNFTRGDRLQVYAVAYDHLGNYGEWKDLDGRHLANFTVGNRRPVVSITEPTPGSTVSGIMPISWTINDPDGDPIEVRIIYKAVAAEEWRRALTTNITSARGSHQFDTTELIDGDYDFELSAYDGAFYAVVSFNVTIKNDRAPLEDVRVPTSSPKRGESLVVSAVVTKNEVISVKAIIWLDGIEFTTIDMNDEGNDGDATAGDRVHSGRFTPTRPGDYRAQVVVEYREEGIRKVHREDVTFSIKTQWTDVLQDNALTWVAIGALGLGAVGVGAWGVTRRW